MWRDILQLDVPVIEKVVRPVLIYVFLAVALRLAGKRELAQLNSLDFVVLLAVANAVENSIIGDDDSVTGGVLGASALFVLNGVLAVLLFRRPKLRRLAEGTPRTLISMGVVDHDALRKERLTEDQLMAAIATQGAGGLDDVEQAVLVPNGTIVTRMKEMDRDAMRFMELTRQIDELKAMVASLSRTSAGPLQRTTIPSIVNYG
jgi:uncharacterized membrane protein YcaP (DUF421 family)